MAAQDIEQLVLSISADTAQMRRALKRLEGDTDSSTRAIEKRFDNLGKKIGRSFDGIGRSAKAALGSVVAAFSLREAQSLIDSATRIDNALKVAGLDGEKLNAVYDQLFRSAQKNAAPLETLVTLYGRAALVQKELNISQEELLGFTDKVALALRVAGTDAQSASGALLQLSQALGSGTVRAEEFNSILEGALPIAQAAANGLKEAGGSVAKLRALVVDGKVSSEAFFRAFEAGSSILEDKVARAETTVSQGFVRLQNVLIDTAKEFNKSSGAAQLMSQFLGELGGLVQDLGGWVSAATKPLAEMAGFLNSIANAANSASASLGRMIGADRIGKWLGAPASTAKMPGASSSDITKRIQDLRRQQSEITGASAEAEKRIMQGTIDALEEQLAGTYAGSSGPSTRGSRGKPIELKPVTIGDYPVDGDGKGKKKRSTKERADEYERLAKRIADTTAETVAETEAQRQLNPLVNDYGYAAEKARMERELLTAAEEAGKKVTPALRAEIAALADQYAIAGVESAKLAETQDELRQAFEDTRELGKDVMGGFISDLVEGKSASEALAGALKKVGDRLLEIAMNDLFGKSGSSGMGILGQLFGSIFGGGGGGAVDPWGGMRAAGGPVQKGKAYVVGEKRPELFVPDQSGSILPSVPQMPALAAPAGGGGASFSFAPVIDARGADVAAVDRLQKVVAKQQMEFESRVKMIVKGRPNGRW